MYRHRYLPGSSPSRLPVGHHQQLRRPQGIRGLVRSRQNREVRARVDRPDTQVFERFGAAPLSADGPTRLVGRLESTAGKQTRRVSASFGSDPRGRDTPRVPREGAPFSVARPRNHRSGWRAQKTRLSWRARCATSVRRDEVARPSAKGRHRFRGDKHLRRLMAHPTIEKNGARYTPTKVVVRGARRVVGNSVPPTAARHSPGTRSRAWCRAHARHPLRAWGRARFVPRSRSAFSFAPRASVGVSFPHSVPSLR